MRFCKSRAAAILAILGAAVAEGATENTLFRLKPWPRQGEVQPGANPTGGLLRDNAGALYGATSSGAAYYHGAIFKLTPPARGNTGWTMSVLYSFTGGQDGSSPNGDLIMDADGAIYGTAARGGSWLNQGLVFKLTPPARTGGQWTYGVIHWFYHDYVNKEADGANPHGGLIMDRFGNLFGTTGQGGLTQRIGEDYGTVFVMSPADAAKTRWYYKVIYRFLGGADGATPLDALAMDTNGNLYGTTVYGGTGPCQTMKIVAAVPANFGCGTIFRLSPPAYAGGNWTKTTLHHFDGGAGGASPLGRPLIAFGALIGAAYKGGTGNCQDGLGTWTGCGVIYSLAPPANGGAWVKSVLLNFNVNNGYHPQGGLTADRYALYGTASESAPSAYGVPGDGLVFQLTPPAAGQRFWTQTILHTFDVRDSGSTPVGDLIMGSNGRLYGVTNSGGGESMGGSGTVYEIAQ